MDEPKVQHQSTVWLSRPGKITTFILLGHRPIGFTSIDGYPHVAFNNTAELLAHRKAYTAIGQCLLDMAAGNRPPELSEIAKAVGEARQ